MGFLSNMLCDLIYAPAVRADARRAHESYRQFEREQTARWAKEARQEDCWYRGGGVAAPQHGYWSDGSIKVDRWTGKTFPKGKYFLNSRGQNAVLLDVPPGAKQCPR